jgi:hypothetical protein
MAEEDDFCARSVGGKTAIDGPQIVQAFAPPVPVGEVTEVGLRRAWSVAAMIAGVNQITLRRECAGKTLIAAGMLAHAV